MSHIASESKPNNDPWAALPHCWLSIGLPGFKWESTYQGYRLEDMPRVPIPLDDELNWLRLHGEVHPGDGLDHLDEHAKPLPPEMVLDFAAEAGISLPVSFKRFMGSLELQSLVRSCTDCYLDPGERVVETVGEIPGHLLHFLSDSQSCAHWYVHVHSSGRSAVLESPDLYCYRIENSDWMLNPACRLEQIDLTKLEFSFCASSFAEFLFRFWIENEIWYAVHNDENRRSLNDIEAAYLNR